MAGTSKKSFNSPDESRKPSERTKVEILDLGSVKIGRATFQPGWRWSTDVKPKVGGESCQARHVGTCESGYLGIIHDDGSMMEIGPGDAYVIEPGHDGEVIGHEPFVGYEFEAQTVETYGK